MTLQDLFNVNSAWHLDTMLTVTIRKPGVWPTVRDHVVNLSKDVWMSEVVCFNGDAVIVCDYN